MTFSEYIISQYTKNFYLISLGDISKSGKTLEEWFPQMYFEWNLLCRNAYCRQLIIEKTNRLENQ